MATIDLTQGIDNLSIRSIDEVKGINEVTIDIPIIEDTREEISIDSSIIDEKQTINVTTDNPSAPIKNTQVTIPNNNVNIATYKDLFRTAGKNRGKKQGELSSEESVEVELSKLEDRVSDNFESTQIFLKNLLPYVLTDFATSSKEAVTNPKLSGLITTTARDVLTNLQKLKYFTAAELAALSASNFYTLHIAKASIQPKRVKQGTFGISTLAKDNQVVTGQPDILFGSDQKDYFSLGDISTAVSNLIYGKNSTESSSGNAVAETFKKDNEVFINLNSMKKIVGGNTTEDLSDRGYVSYEDKTSHYTGLLKGKYAQDLYNQIGYILISPVKNEKNEYIKIPFEFNPIIDEGPITGKYSSTSILNRIGEIQTYTGTSSIQVNLITNYIALSDGKYINDGPAGWMNKYTQSFLKEIEMAYRSLGYPAISGDESIDSGLKYLKPPIVRVIVGDENNSNILNYGSDNNKRRYFIANSIKITKNLNDIPVYMEDQKIIDSMGFEVNLSLIEVKKSYYDMPLNYYDYKAMFPNLIETSVNKE